jgi:hypothetical protein
MVSLKVVLFLLRLAGEAMRLRVSQRKGTRR